MTTSFVAYIDESGDEGFKFLPNEQGSSRWFVLSALLLTQLQKVSPLAQLQHSGVGIDACSFARVSVMSRLRMVN
jgi:hypothetical protein